MRLKNKKGATLTEYAVILALMGIVAIVSLSLLGFEVLRSFTSTEEQIDVGVGGGGALPGPGGGQGSGSVPPPPNEASKTCVVDAPGPDEMQESQGRGAYTFPGDCLLITTDGDVLFGLIDDIHPGASYHARVNVDPTDLESSLVFWGGPNHTLVHESGDVNVWFEATTGAVWATHANFTDVTLSLPSQNDLRLDFPDGSFINGLYMYAGTDVPTAQWTSDIVFHFADRSITSTDMKPFLFAALTTAGDDTIDGSGTSEVVVLDEGGNDTLSLGGGQDRVVWTAGSFTIASDVLAEEDTLDMSSVPSSSVVRAVDGMDYVMTLPGGRTARIAFGSILGASLSKGIDRIVLSDTVIENADMAAWFAGP